MIIDADVYLEHYGIPGMKWGVRRSKAELARGRTSPSAELRKQAKADFKKTAFASKDSPLERRIEYMFDQRGLGAVPYSELSNRRRTIEAGKTFYRVSSAQQEMVRSENDIRYVSTTKKDHNRYVATLPKHTFRSGFKEIKPTYEQVYKTTTKLTLPSEKERMDAFAELMDTPSVKVGRKTLTGREVLKRSGYARDVKRLDSIALGQKYFNSMQATAWQNRGLADAYFKNLRDKGFNAVADDNDRGILSDDPVILLNPNGTVKSMQVRQLQPEDVYKAMSSFDPRLKTAKK